ASFQLSFPSVPINLFDMTCGDQFHALQDGKIDLGFVGLREPIEERGLQFRPIACYGTVVAVAKNNPLAKNRSSTLRNSNRCSLSACQRLVSQVIAAGSRRRAEK